MPSNPEKRRAYMRLYWEAHKEEHSVSGKAWRQSHKEHVRDYGKAYRKAHDSAAQKKYKNTHKEQEAIRGKTYYHAHKEQRAAWSKTYSQTHREQRRTSDQTRRARLHHAFIEKIDGSEVYKRGKGVCGICHRKVSQVHFTLDHILPLAQGGEHSYRNVQVAHKSCNLRKGSWATIPQQLRMIG